MKILVLNGSYRPNGGTAAMASAFIEGAKAAGHEVHELNVAQMEIHGCRGCEFCHTRGGGSCIQHDDMDLVYPLWDEAEMIVLASPIYYGSFSGQMHCMIHRTSAGDKPKKCKKMALLLCSGAHGVYAQAEGIYHGYLTGYYGVEDCGIFEAVTSEAKSSEMAQRLYQFAESL